MVNRFKKAERYQRRKGADKVERKLYFRGDRFGIKAEFFKKLTCRC